MKKKLDKEELILITRHLASILELSINQAIERNFPELIGRDETDKELLEFNIESVVSILGNLCSCFIQTCINSYNVKDYDEKLIFEIIKTYLVKIIDAGDPDPSKTSVLTNIINDNVLDFIKH